MSTIKPKTNQLAIYQERDVATQDEQQKRLKGKTEEKPEEESDKAVPSPRASRDDKNYSNRLNQAATTPEAVLSNNKDEEPEDEIEINKVPLRSCRPDENKKKQQQDHDGLPRMRQNKVRFGLTVSPMQLCEISLNTNPCSIMIR